MSLFRRNLVVIAVLALIAFGGVALSLSAPYVSNDDEMVYLVGAHEAKYGDLPDAYMLQGYDYGAYLYPKIMLAWYETLGHEMFKSIYLAVLIIATGIAAYAMFLWLGLPWIPSLLFSVVTLVPRYSAGLEFFGVLTFQEAGGRAMAVPLFLIMTAMIIKRVAAGKSLWPVFGALGLCMFLHPVSVILFAAVSLLASLITLVFKNRKPWRAVSDTVTAGVAFIIGGSYVFITIFERLAHGVASGDISAIAYVQAVVYRNVWEFPAASSIWFRHIAIVSAFFLIMLAFSFMHPWFRTIRTRYPLPHGREIFIWGITASVAALVLCIALPGLNLLLMEHVNAPYVFQQWSRICKFFYLGLFVSLVPTAYALWMAYRNSPRRIAHLLIVLCIGAGLASSSFFFEMAQFALGYKNYDTAYIPQAVSGRSDMTKPDEYREVCDVLSSLGANSLSLIVSSEFPLRYYCKSHLYTTDEEGAAYFQLSRSDLVAWYERETSQERALKSKDLATIRTFAHGIGAEYVVLPDASVFMNTEEIDGDVVATTTRHIVIKLAQ